MSLEEFLKLPEKRRHDYLRDKALLRMQEEGFKNIQKEKELGKNRERRIDIYGEKDGKRFGVEIWTRARARYFAITYKAFSIPIELDTTVTTTSGDTNWVSYRIDRTGDTNPITLMFRVFTAGAFYDQNNQEGGLELHVWDMSGAG